MNRQNTKAIFHKCTSREDELDIAMRENLRENLNNAVIIIPSSEDYYFVKRYFNNKKFRYKLTYSNTDNSINLPALVVAQTPQLHCNQPACVFLFFEKIKNKDEFLKEICSSSSIIHVTFSDISSEEYSSLLDKGFNIRKRDSIIEEDIFNIDDSDRNKSGAKCGAGIETEEDDRSDIEQYTGEQTTGEGTGKTSRFMVNEEIREVFINTFVAAESEIDIISPLMSDSVVDEELLILMENALQRGVRIKIIYGIGNGEDERGIKSEKVAEVLNSRLDRYGDLFKIKKSNIHL